MVADESPVSVAEVTTPSDAYVQDPVQAVVVYAIESFVRVPAALVHDTASVVAVLVPTARAVTPDGSVVAVTQEETGEVPLVFHAATSKEKVEAVARPEAVVSTAMPSDVAVTVPEHEDPAQR